MPRAGEGSGMEHRAEHAGSGRPAMRPGEPPRTPVRARTGITPQALVDRADVTPRTPEAETVLRIFRRRQQEHAAFYVAETRDLASLWSEGDEGDEKALHALAASVGMRAKLPRGEDRLRDAHVAVTDLPACFARVESGALPVEWFEWLIRSILRLTSHQRRQVDERVAAWQLESIDVERFYRELHTLVMWFGRAAVQETPQEQRSVSLASSPDSDGTACLLIRGPIPEITAFGQRLDAAARAVQDEQRRALAGRRPVPFDLDGVAARDERPLSLAALRYAILTRSLLDTGGIEVPGSHLRLQVVVPAMTLLGESDAPGTLNGTVPLPAPLARHLAAGASTWFRILSDPADGEFLPLPAKRYSPTAAMQEHLRSLDPVCAVPGCTRNTCTIGETDHIEEYDHRCPENGGQTAIENLHRLCWRHHDMKTRGVLDPVRHPDGSTRWFVDGHPLRRVEQNRDLLTPLLAAELRDSWEIYQEMTAWDEAHRDGLVQDAEPGPRRAATPADVPDPPY